MTSNKINNELLNIFIKIFNLKKINSNKIEKIHKDDVKSWDSLKQINLILSLEQSFKVKFSDNEAIKLNSYPYILKLLKSKLKKKKK
tara:strand:- start:5003 stop:5263 length:261 start_codon:yes stop_codon:yes gene_type:complete